METLSKELLSPSWDGTTLTTIILVNEQKFKIKCGLANGGGYKDAYILGVDGWAYFLSTFEIGFKNENEISYVSSEENRQEYAHKMSKALIKAVEKVA